jgi:hypothetical protein
MENKSPLDNGHLSENLGPSDSPESPEYHELVESYQAVTRKERSIQIAGTVLSISAIGLELIVFYFIDRLTEHNVPWDTLRRYIGMYIIVAIVIGLGLTQLITVSKWNASVKEKTRHSLSSQAQGSSHSLTQINYNMIQHIKRMQTIVSIILFFIVLFFFFYFQERMPIPTIPEKLIIYRIYMGLRSLAAIIIFGYLAIEIIELIRWTRRLTTYLQVENKIKSELPELFNFNQMDNQ